MKTLKFREHLSRMILSGVKTTTWRLFDDKDLQVGDEVTMIVSETQQQFARALLTEVKETTLGALTDADWEGHERFATDQEMYETYELYYSRPVDQNSSVKIIKFTLQ